MPKEVEELVFVWASRLSPYPWVRFDYPFPFVIRSKNRGELQCLLKQNTVFGYIASGSIPIYSENKPRSGLIKDNVDLEKTMRRFWEIENVEPETIKIRKR
ncbi:hypothetical protein TNCV_962251 [Trichonephila clavipes]|nr:hypothetical protein TNCV_962251 [Trichonephila clavipes]